MSADWPKVALEEVITHRKEFIEIDDFEEYKRCRVQLHAKGIVLRDTIFGASIKTKKQQVCRAGEFLVAEIDAKVGGFGIVPEDLSGAIVSSHYFLFETDEAKLNRTFLDFFIRTPYFHNQVYAQGSTNYAAIRPNDVLGYEIPLPLLDEQRRIVARIEELAARIDEAQKLRRQAAEEAEALFAATTRSLFDSKLGSVVTIEELVGKANLKNGLSIRATDEDSPTRCLRLSALRDGNINCEDSKPVPLNETEATPYLIQDNDIFIVRGNGSKYLVGRAGMVEENVTHTIFPDLFIRVPLDKNQILPQFFVAWWNSQKMRDIIEETAKTTSGIWKINQGHIASFSIPILSLPEQRRIVAHLDELQAKVDALKKYQAQSGQELDALLPSVLDRAFKGEL